MLRVQKQLPVDDQLFVRNM